MIDTRCPDHPGGEIVPPVSILATQVLVSHIHPLILELGILQVLAFGVLLGKRDDPHHSSTHMEVSAYFKRV